MRRVAALILLLGACSAKPVALPRTEIPLRNPTAQVASQADAALSRLAGGWVVVSGAGLAPGDRLTFGRDFIVLDGVSLPLREVTPGRLMVGEDALWVHWLDADNRTAAMGDPAGSRVWIMDRTGRPGERLRAAREILDWYGYDLARMEGG